MPRSHTEQALVLRVYDVGEADRFCILFTEGLGKISARARAVRKMKSRFGGSMLPLQRVSVQLTESSAGYLVTGAECLDAHDGCRTNMGAYRDALEACELLLKSLPEKESAPAVFSLTCDFFKAAASTYDSLSLIAFKLRLLSEFGMLPSHQESVVSHKNISDADQLCFSRKYSGFCLPAEDVYAARLSPLTASFLRSVMTEHLGHLQAISPTVKTELTQILSYLVSNQFATTSAPSRVAPLAVGSPTTPTW